MINTNVFNFKKNDEYLTPSYVVEVIIPFLKENKIKKIWCPADLNNSKFVLVLKKYNFQVFNSHIFYGEDFLKTEKELFVNKIDLILTNPPFSLKNEFIKKANKLRIPFMFLLGLQVLNYKNIAELLRDNQASIIYLIGSRISYNGSQSTFQSAYFTNLVNNKIIYLNLTKGDKNG